MQVLVLTFIESSVFVTFGAKNVISYFLTVQCGVRHLLFWAPSQYNPSNCHFHPIASAIEDQMI
jgi:hypothetical protein